MSGAHLSEKRWYRNQNVEGNESLADKVHNAVRALLMALSEGESVYQELQDLSKFTGGSAQNIADQLFKEKWKNRESDPYNHPGEFDEKANKEEVAMVQDALNAVQAIHDLNDVLSGRAVKKKDRASILRRMG